MNSSATTEVMTSSSLPLVISFFSHKGGVGKTTCLHNIACVLTKVFKLKILVVDMDTQASLTGLVMHKDFVERGKKKFNKLSSKEKEVYKKNKHFAKLGEIAFLEEDREHKRSTSFELYKGIINESCSHNLAWVNENLKEVINEVEPIKINGGKDDEFLFIAGDRRISHIDQELAEAFAAVNSRASFGYFYNFMPGVITGLLRRVAKKHVVDLILIDFGPSPTPLTRSAFMGSDYFVVNSLADFLSRWSIESLVDFIKSWDLSSKVLRQEKLKDMRLPPCPKFLGSIISRIKIYSNDMTNSKKGKVDLIKSEIENYLSPFKDSDAKYILNPTLIRDFTRLNDLVEETGLSICQINVSDIAKKERTGSNNVSDEDIKKGQLLYLNSYFTAVMGLFANLSEQHHRALGNVFRLDINSIFPKEDSKIDGLVKDADENELLRVSAGNHDLRSVLDLNTTFQNIFDSVEDGMSKGLTTDDLSGDIYCAFSCKLSGKKTPKILKEFGELKKDFVDANIPLDLIIKEIQTKKGSFFNHIIKVQLPADPQLHKLSYRIGPEVEKSVKSKKKAELIQEGPSQDEARQEKDRKDENLAEKYISAYRTAREAAAKLVKFLRSSEAVGFYLSLAKNSRDKQLLGEDFFCTYAKLSHLTKTKLFVPNSTGDNSLSLYQAFSPNIHPQENRLVLCETLQYKKYFYRLDTKKKRPIDSGQARIQAQKNSTQTMRTNEHGKREDHRSVDNGSLKPRKGRKK